MTSAPRLVTNPRNPHTCYVFRVPSWRLLFLRSSPSSRPHPSKRRGSRSPDRSAPQGWAAESSSVSRPKSTSDPCSESPRVARWRDAFYGIGRRPPVGNLLSEGVPTVRGSRVRQRPGAKNQHQFRRRRGIRHAAHCESERRGPARRRSRWRPRLLGRGRAERSRNHGGFADSSPVLPRIFDLSLDRILVS